MTLKCGIVGLPNVGKSTLFNALTSSSIAAAANYPFCTIEPNSAIVAVPDIRLEKLAKIAGSQKIIPAYIQFVDIAGLVQGASKGEGLGNKFLSHIREVDAIIHVLRCFEDPNITHVHGKVDPIYDAEIIETELIIADFESVERRLSNSQKRFKSGDKALNEQIELLQHLSVILKEGRPARSVVDVYNQKNIEELQLLSAKPLLYVCNVLEEDAKLGNKLTQVVVDKAHQKNTNAIVISSKIEAEIANLENAEEKAEFLATIGLTSTGLHQIITTGYNLLNLQSFFTIGPKEAHAWTFEAGSLAPEAAGIIHTDFEKGFIRAEVISYEDYIKYAGEIKAKEAGKMRLEGKEYIVQDGDIVHFRFNV